MVGLAWGVGGVGGGGGLAVAIRDWGGAVVMISHNAEFVGALCPEKWHVDAGGWLCK